MAIQHQPIIVKQCFNASIDTVWHAITKAEQMRQWFFENIETFDPKVGFYTQFNVQSGGRNFLHQWKLTEVIPFEKIVYHWTYAEYSGEGYVTFALSQQENQTQLQIINRGMESFTEEIPEFSRESCRGGWEYFINRLKNFLEN